MGNNSSSRNRGGRNQAGNERRGGANHRQAREQQSDLNNRIRNAQAAQQAAAQPAPAPSGGSAPAAAEAGSSGAAANPQMQHTYTIRNDVNLKKNTISLIKNANDSNLSTLEFTFDSAVEGTVEVYLGAVEVAESETKTNFKCKYKDTCPPIKFSKGLGQKFSLPAEHSIVMSRVKKEDYEYNPETHQWPLVIRLTTPTAASPDSSSKTVSSQSTFATLKERDDESIEVRVSKQKIQVGSMAYELQEIYGIESNASGGAAPDPSDDDGKECVICMSEPRDTTVLPCRHMCMCSECAKVLRYQTNKCPICRCNVESLLQIKVSKKKKSKNKAAAPAAPTEGAASTS